LAIISARPGQKKAMMHTEWCGTESPPRQAPTRILPQPQ